MGSRRQENIPTGGRYQIAVKDRAWMTGDRDELRVLAIYTCVPTGIQSLLQLIVQIRLPIVYLSLPFL